ncbi:MAG: hypothetical protein SVW77_03210, partial [Candidatus Nanohaloarchaea archaeon]|nr:hypothetical protein [Candidatus Nanohaloarchaea archaeon]
MTRVLVVAFDGMDKDLIEQFELEHVVQDEYGQIDNQTGMKETNTDELFASFITGKTWKEHGVTGIKEWDNPVLNTIDRIFPRRGPLFRIGTFGRDLLTGIGGFERERYTRDKLQCESLFDKVPDSRSLNVPVHDVNPDLYVFPKVLDRYGIDHAEREAEKEFEQRREEFAEAMDDEPATFFMAHFHYID